MTDAPMLLELNNVTRRFGDQIAVSQASLAIRPGEIHGILGENGSGKTTLLKLVGGLFPPDEGSMRFDGRPFAPRSPADALNQGIVLIQNASSLMDNLSIAENTLKGLYPRRRLLGMIDWKHLYRSCDTLYRSLGIEFDVHAAVGTLNVREKRLVELVRADVLGARLVMIDELDISSDDRHYQTFRLLLDRVIQRHGAVLIATHRIEEILKIATRVTVLANGEICFSDERLAASRHAILQFMAGGQGPIKDIYPKLREFSGRPVLSLQQVTTAGGLRDFSLDIRKGEVLGISSLTAGPRMALAHTLFGLDDVKAGRILLNGEKIQVRDPSAAVRLGIGFLSEDRVAWGLESEFPIPPNISLSNLREIRRFGLLRKRREADAARGFMRRFAIKTPSIWEPVAHLSTGNQRKVLLARWLFSDCRILILEEPTKNIDKSTKIEVYNFMNGFVQNGGTILFISSHIEELIGMCDRIVAFASGGQATLFSRPEFNKEAIIDHGL